MESQPIVSESSLSRCWAEIDWNALHRLRAGFLEFDDAAVPTSADYWESERTLRSYDLTFGERIGWKWDAVLDELQARGWTPPEGAFLDYGCGSGVAGRRVVARWPDACQRLLYRDRSAVAMRYSVQAGREAFPGHTVEPAGEGEGAQMLLLSHLLNELDAAGLDAVLELAMRAEVVLWVEPGTAAVGRKLVDVRERLLASSFTPIAPCPHSGSCGLLQTGNERHWCHHFAKPPGAVFQDGAWARFAQALEIDLTTLPLSFLVLDRRAAPIAFQTGLESRVLGRPRVYKGYHKILSCQAEGVEELTLQKRDAPALHKAIRKQCGTLYRWERGEAGGKIRAGERLV